MTELNSKKYMEKTQTESNLYITSNDINIEISKEFLEELQMNAYHRWIDEDMINHIAMVLKMIDSIYIPSVDSHQLRMKIFSLSLADEAKQWWINEGDGKITVWEELVKKILTKKALFHDWMNVSWNKRRMVDKILSNNNTAADSFLKPYLINHGKSNTEKEDEQIQTKRKYCDTSESIDEQPCKRICKTEKFEAI
nr:hypothetical protein [Tanacetum cinerariifolium]